MEMKRPQHMAAIILAAGRSSRMKGTNKLVADLHGQSVISHVVQCAKGATLSPIIVVLGHQAEDVRMFLSNENVSFVQNKDFDSGMASSIRRGIAALPDDVQSAFLMLGDMPHIRSETLRAMGNTLSEQSECLAVAPVYKGERGNPVLWHRAAFPQLNRLSGDKGARDVLGTLGTKLALVQVNDPAILLDADTPAAMAYLRDYAGLDEDD